MLTLGAVEFDVEDAIRLTPPRLSHKLQVRADTERELRRAWPFIQRASSPGEKIAYIFTGVVAAAVVFKLARL